MSIAQQSDEHSFNKFRDEVLGTLRKMESNLNTKFSELENNFKKDFENYKTKLDYLTVDYKEMKELFMPYKIQIEKISDIEKYKNKSNDMLIAHEFRIKNNTDEINRVQLRYDKLISENLYVPGYVGSACQFKTLSEYISYNINEVSKIKLDREQTKKDFKEFKTKQDNILKSMNTLNESTIQICNNYSDGKNNEIKEILNRSLEQLNQKSFEMKTMIYQFEENAKKIIDKTKEELENIIEIKNNINKQITNTILETKKFNEEINKKIKEHNDGMNTQKKKVENLLEQIKDINKNINNINIKIKNINNTSNININRNKMNIYNSVSPFKERKFKALIDIDKNNKNSPIKTVINNNKSKNKSELSLESIITENSIENQKEIKNIKINTDIKLESKEKLNNNNNKIVLNTISSTNDINNKTKINNDSLNNTNTNSIKISSIQNSKNRTNNNTIDINNNNKSNLLPVIIKNKIKEEKNFFLEESKKANENNNQPLKQNKRYSPNTTKLKIRNTQIIFHLENDNNDDNKYNNNINNEKYNKTIMEIQKKRNSVNVMNKNILLNSNNNNNIMQSNKVKFDHRKEIILKKSSDNTEQKGKEKQGLKLISLNLPENENKNNKNIKEELKETIDIYRANAFTNIKNIKENNIEDIIDTNKEMIDFPRKITQAFGRTTYNFFTKNDIINHINANKNINNFEITNNKNKK